MIRHIWFDFSETLAFINKEAHDKLRYESYAKVIDKPVTAELIEEYEKLYKEHNRSNAAVFRSLGFSSNYWSEQINSVDPRLFYYLADESIPSVLDLVRKNIPISLFSNVQLDKVLTSLSINPDWFIHILSSGMVKEPKPALDGFYKIIELSNLPADEILYIGDDVGKDVIPSKTVGVKAGLIWKESEEADYSFKTFGEILELIKSQKSY